MAEKTAKFKVGDRVIVTGDVSQSAHTIDLGSEVTVLTQDWYADEWFYLVSVNDTPEEAFGISVNLASELVSTSDLWTDCEVEWVGEADLKPNEEPAFTLHKIENGQMIDMTGFFSDVNFSAFTDLPSDERIDEPDAVNHPAHYTSDPSGVECITVTRHRNFNIGNAMKYLWRAGLKDADTHTEDLRKAIWYINDEIERLEGGDG